MNALITRTLFPRSFLRDVGSLSREVDALFDGVFGGRDVESGAEWTPHVETYADGDSLHVRADLPGVDPKAVDVSVEKDVLTIRGERNTERREAAYREVRYGRFERHLRLPEGTEPDKITATYEKGVLDVTIPVAKPVSRKVAINVADTPAPTA